MYEEPYNYNEYPFIVIWEVTRACALKCLHCRAEAKYTADPCQLTFKEGKNLIDEIAKMNNPLFVFTGGDPLMRPDLFELADYAINERNISLSMTPSATPKVTKESIQQAKDVGLSRWAFSLDGSNATIHDFFRGTNGSFDRTLQGIRYLNELNIPIQINTTVSKYNIDDLKAISELVRDMDAILWSLFFLIPTGRAQVENMLLAEQHEEVMEWLVTVQEKMPYHVKATEAPHYRRVLMQHHDRNKLVQKHEDILGRAPKSVNDGDGFIFISHTGDVYPSGFLPIKCGNVRDESLISIYQNSQILKNLRDKSLLKGKCGICPYKQICGGSRARAYAITGDYLESDPTCNYYPTI